MPGKNRSSRLSHAPAAALVYGVFGQEPERLPVRPGNGLDGHGTLGNAEFPFSGADHGANFGKQFRDIVDDAVPDRVTNAAHALDFPGFVVQPDRAGAVQDMQIGQRVFLTVAGRANTALAANSARAAPTSLVCDPIGILIVSPCQADAAEGIERSVACGYRDNEPYIVYFALWRKLDEVSIRTWNWT